MTLKEVLEERDREAKAKQSDFELIIEDQRGKMERLDRNNMQLEEERGALHAEIKEARWALD